MSDTSTIVEIAAHVAAGTCNKGSFVGLYARYADW